ncbi:MAG TPA: cation:proton antiporter [Sphingomicrobium sp.]|nr:cation:proton antiporter [Sphingomicrobium sp.]
MPGNFSTSGFSDALVILGAAGIVIPAFARLRISPVIGFIIVGMIVGPAGLGGLTDDVPGLHYVTISNPHAIDPFAELGIILLLFSIGLELSFRRLVAMRKAVFRIGAAELLLGTVLIAGALSAAGQPLQSAIALGFALAMSSTALVLPIAGTTSPVGRAAFAMLLFEDLALVPLLFVFGTAAAASATGLLDIAWKGALVIAGLLLVGRFVLPLLFAQAARTKSPELFLAVSLLVVILSSLATRDVGLSPILGALIAGVLLAETEYHAEVEIVTAPFRGLALGIFLITVGMRIDFRQLAEIWPELLLALTGVLAVKALVTGILLRMSGSTAGVAAETGLLMSSPSETTLILLGAAAATGVIAQETATFWQAATAVGLTITPLLAHLGRLAARRVDPGAEIPDEGQLRGQTIIFGFGRVGKMVADLLTEHGKPYIAVDSDIDNVLAARSAGYTILFGDVSRSELVEKLRLGNAAALVLTMDDPVLVARIARRVRGWSPGLAIIARARDTDHAAKLYEAGVTDAVPETLEASLQLSEAVLVDIGVPMGPVIASIHEKRSELRSEIMAQADMKAEPRLGRRRLRDAGQSS